MPDDRPPTLEEQLARMLGRDPTPGLVQAVKLLNDCPNRELTLVGREVIRRLFQNRQVVIRPNSETPP